ncbi:hypothetical protein D3C76_1745100 [compost metagenome]
MAAVSGVPFLFSVVAGGWGENIRIRKGLSAFQAAHRGRGSRHGRHGQYGYAQLPFEFRGERAFSTKRQRR